MLSFKCVLSPALLVFFCLTISHAQNQLPPGSASEVASLPAHGDTRPDLKPTAILSIRVTDAKQNVIPDLSAANFSVFEDDARQDITAFNHNDEPVSVGILVDNSGSMRHKRAAVVEAMKHLVQLSNPQDEIFVVNFNDEAYLDQDFTSDYSRISKALDRADARGGTALYDALTAANDHLARFSKYQMRGLIIVTDGLDNESRTNLELLTRKLQGKAAPLVYTIGILEGDPQQILKSERAFDMLAKQSGGLAFFPTNARRVDEAAQQIARDLRQQYTVAYHFKNSADQRAIRHVKVSISYPRKGLRIRTNVMHFEDPERLPAPQQ